MLVALLGGAAAAQNEPASVNLRPNWEAGQQSQYRLEVHRQRQRTLMAGGQQREATTRTDITGQITWTVDSVQSNGAATCTLRHDWMKMVMTGPQGEQKVNDSRRGSGDIKPIQSMLSALTDNPLTVGVAPDGSIENISGGDAIRRAVANPDYAPSDRDLRSTAASVAPLPQPPADAQPGATWDRQHTEGHTLGEMQYNQTYELAGLETIASIPIATVTVEAEMDLTVQQPNRPANAPSTETEMLESGYRGFVIFDLLRREAVGRYSRQHQLIEQTITARGRTMTQRIDEQTQSTLLRIDEQ
jgi:hypothetical protein